MKKGSLLILFVSTLLSTQAQENYLQQQTKHLVKPIHLVHNGAQSRSAHYDDYDVKSIKLEFYAEPTVDTIQGSAQLNFVVSKSALDTLRFDFSSSSFMNVDSINVDGNVITNFSRNNDELFIPLPSTLSQGKAVESFVSFNGTPGKISGSSGYFFSGKSGNGDKAFWTMSEPMGAKFWWPCKMDLYDKADSLQISIVHSDKYYAAAQGNLQSRTLLGNGLAKTIWKHNYPIANYLIAIAVGEYKTRTSTLHYNGKTLTNLDYLYKSDSAWFGVSKTYLEPAFALYDSLFGAYPFEKEKYGHAQFTRNGGMEHQTMSWMQNLNQPLVAHELAHQWFGDKVTCGSWQDLWLNESFATYLTALTYEAGVGLRDWMGWKQSTTAFIISQPYGSVWVDDTSDLIRLFSSRLTYNKGAYVLHMLRHECGDSAFFQGAKNYLKNPSLAYKFARTKDLQNHLEASSGLQLDEFFRDWFYGEGFPNYNLNWRMVGNSIHMKLTQTQSHSSVSFYEMNVPIAVYKNGKRKDILYPHINNTSSLTRNLGYIPDSVKIDPDLWILVGSKNIYEGVHVPVSVAELNGKPMFSIFPNPASNQLHLNAIQFLEEDFSVLVYDQLGHVVLAEKFEKESSLLQLNISNLQTGVYQIKLISEGLIEQYRFVKE